MKTFNYLMSLTTLVIILTACQKQFLFTDAITGEATATTNTTNEVIRHNNHCGDPIVHPFTVGQFFNAGTITIENNETDLFVTYQTTADWVLGATHVYVGPCDDVPVNNNGIPVIGQFPLQTAHNPPVSTFTYIIPLSELDASFCIFTHAEAIEVDGGGNPTGRTETGFGGDIPNPPSINRWFFFADECEQECFAPQGGGGGCDPGDFRTQTMGGWGANPSGGNPGAYLHANFASCFPTGLTVACSFTLTLTSAQAVTDFLPSGGKPASLEQDYTDPTGLSNTLAGQTVALTLAVTFDACDPNFGASTSALGDLVVAAGAFQGFTVQEVLNEAIAILGGCPSSFSPSEVSEALSAINENFVDGTVVGGFLDCN